MKQRVCLFFLLLCFLFHMNIFAQWRFGGRVNLPDYHYSFLATNPQGNLLAVTFNTSREHDAELPALLIRNPTSSRPEVIELSRETFSFLRGYSGVACDDFGNYYVSSDNGISETSFIRKYLPDGTPDNSFGSAGRIRPGLRVLGIDVVSNYLFAAVEWGIIHIYNINDGSFVAQIRSNDAVGLYIRDISVEPTTMDIYGIVQGGVVVWQGGSPWNPGGYSFRIVTEQQIDEPRSGEGILFDPVERRVIISPRSEPTLQFVNSNGLSSGIVLRGLRPGAAFCDSALSYDSRTLFISDMSLQSIYYMQRPLEDSSIVDASVSTTEDVPEITPPSTPLQPLRWYTSYNDALKISRQQNKPMVLYFGKRDLPQGRKVEQEVLISDAFNYYAQGFIPIRIDADRDPMLGIRLGVYRLPTILVADARGDILGRFVYNIDKEQLFRTLRAAQ